MTIAEEVLSENQFVAKVIPIRITKDMGGDRGVSRSLPEDPFESLYGERGIIEPPYDLFTLAVMPEVSSELGPAIEAMSVNIEKLGHRIVPRDGLPRDESVLSNEVIQERAKVSNFFSNAVLEPTETFITLREQVRVDLESTGNGYVESLPTLVTGEPAGLNHMASWQMRLRVEDSYFTECTVPRAVQQVDGTWTIVDFPYRKRFRRFVQMREDKMVFFKEWGDPRAIDSRTGDPFTDEDLASEDFNPGWLATEIIHFKLYCPRSPYGLPRWIGNLFNIFGNRAAEVINYTTFRNNNVPAMMLMATNVQISSGSIARIKEFIEERIQGDNNYSTILIVEGEPIGEGMRDPGTMKLEVKELTEAQHDDAMFVKYMERGDDKIRRSYRIPPIYMGRADEYTRATADASRKVGEEQIFRPERNHEDAIWNQTVVAALRTPNVVFRSNTPDITDNYELTQLLATAERSGGLSPHISRLIVEDMLGRDLPDISSEIDPNLPFTMTMLREQALLMPDMYGQMGKSLSDDEVLTQLQSLKHQMNDSEGISDDAHKAVDTLIMAIEMGKSVVPIKSLPAKTVPKSDPPPDDQLSEKHIVQLFKADVEGEQHIVGGAVLVPGVVDLQGDIYDADVTEAAAHYWLEHYMEDPEKNGLKIQHKGETIYDAARPLQSWVLDRDMTFEVEVTAADGDHPAKELTTLTYPKGTWILYARIRDEALWEMFKSGELKGWSVGGIATVQQLRKMMMAA